MFISIFPLHATCDYLVNVGDEWTYTRKEQDKIRGTEGIEITSVPDPPGRPLGTKYINGTATEFNQTIDEQYLMNETIIEALKANYTTKTRTYGDISCECIYVKNPVGYTYIDTATGIVVETYVSTTFIGIPIKIHVWVISWSITEVPEDVKEPSTGGGGRILGYNILFIIGIIAVISTIIIIGFKKHFKN
ncbi:MAG: hypothetical protein ACFFB0_01945 [Promethearchaeota archaeon]